MKLQFVLCLCISLLLAGSLSAAETTFISGGDNLWSNIDNWTDGIPDADDKVRLVDGAYCILDIAGQVGKHITMEGAPSHFVVQDGGGLEINDWLIVGYVGGDPEDPHLMEILGGEVNSLVRMNVGFFGAGKLVVDYSGILNVHSQELGAGGEDNGHGVIELKGGEINLLGETNILFVSGNNATGSMDISGGVLTQPYTDEDLANINGYVDDGTITAYGDVGTVVVETVDGVITVKGLHPLNPIPADGGVSVPGTVTLEWTVDAGTPVDVWFGTKVDLSDFTQIVDKQAVTSLNVTTVAKQRYFWTVDTYDPGAEFPNLGPVFDFYADNQPPIADAGDDVTSWLDNGSVEVALNGTVIDVDPTTTLWSVVSEPDDPNSPNAFIADPAALNTTITLSALGEYILQLEADDGEYKDEDTVTINVYSNSCEAAKSLPDYVPLVGDLDEDCDVDQDDLDLLMENWLKCVALGDCDPNTP